MERTAEPAGGADDPDARCLSCRAGSVTPMTTTVLFGESLAIRPARRSDAGAIAAIYAHHVLHGTATFDVLPRPVTDTEAKLSECAGRRWPFLVATHREAVIGYACATAFRDRPAYAMTCEDSIYVHPDHLGQGVGTALLSKLLEAAEEAGFRQMIAVIGGAEPGSIALHARLGFRHAGRMQSVGRKFGRWLDTLYMQIALGDGDRTAPRQEPG